MRFRCYTLYEDITDGKGLCYRFDKDSGVIGAILFILFGSKGDPSSYKYERGKRIEWSDKLSTEILNKKGQLNA